MSDRRWVVQLGGSSNNLNRAEEIKKKAIRRTPNISRDIYSASLEIFGQGKGPGMNRDSSDLWERGCKDSGVKVDMNEE